MLSEVVPRHICRLTSFLPPLRLVVDQAIEPLDQISGSVQIRAKARNDSRARRRETATRRNRKADTPLKRSSRGMTPEPNPAQAIVAPKIAGGVTASLPFYRPIQKRRHRPLKSDRRNGSCCNARRPW